jgi:electron transfer flavoprotein beta subunit
LKADVRSKGLKIIVLVKWVPSTSEELIIDESGRNIKKAGVNFTLNEFDNYALEEGLRLKEETNGHLTAIAMGPLEYQEALVIALAKGADEAIHLNYEGEYDAWVASEILARLITTLEYDIIFTGLEATDTNEGQVGVLIAEKLKIPHVAAVTKVEVSDGKTRVIRELGGGVSEELEVPIPALFATLSSKNPPRYAPLMKILAARRRGLKCLELKDIRINIDIVKPRVRIVKMLTPERKKTLKIISGKNVEEQVANLFNILLEKGVV